MKDRLNKVLKTIDNLENMFEDVDVVFALEEIKAQVNEILNVAQ